MDRLGEKITNLAIFVALICGAGVFALMQYILYSSDNEIKVGEVLLYLIVGLVVGGIAAWIIWVAIEFISKLLIPGIAFILVISGVIFVIHYLLNIVVWTSG